MKYIDFDGVILDTLDLIFEEWDKDPEKAKVKYGSDIEYVKAIDWNNVVNNSPIINDSIYYLRQMDPKTNAILTRVHTLENEGTAKIIYLREKNVQLPVILSPYTLSKSFVVPAKDNILIDDALRNLYEWELAGGVPYFFDKDWTNIDSWGEYNEKGITRVRKVDK